MPIGSRFQNGSEDAIDEIGIRGDGGCSSHMVRYVPRLIKVRFVPIGKRAESAIR